MENNHQNKIISGLIAFYLSHINILPILIYKFFFKYESFGSTKNIVDQTISNSNQDKSIVQLIVLPWHLPVKKAVELIIICNLFNIFYNIYIQSIRTSSDQMIFFSIPSLINQPAPSVLGKTIKNQLTLLLGQTLKKDFQKYRMAKTKQMQQNANKYHKREEEKLIKSQEAKKKQQYISDNQNKQKALTSDSNEEKNQINRKQDQQRKNAKQTNRKPKEVSQLSSSKQKNIIFQNIPQVKVKDPKKKSLNQKRITQLSQEEYDEANIPQFMTMSKKKIISKKLKLLKRRVQKWDFQDHQNNRNKREASRLMK